MPGLIRSEAQGRQKLQRGVNFYAEFCYNNYEDYLTTGPLGSVVPMLTLFTLPLFAVRDLLPLGGEVVVHFYLYWAAGAVLWALGLYLGFFPVAEWVMEQLWRWFNFAERSLYPSQREFEQTRRVRETINAIYASLLSIVPFLVLGLGCAYWVGYHLGPLESLICGVAACIGGGIYELGRRDSQPSA